jgi:hypothetical protein
MPRASFKQRCLEQIYNTAVSEKSTVLFENCDAAQYLCRVFSNNQFIQITEPGFAEQL